jgi:DNA-binding transcriptional LysR family regulator
MTPTYFATQLYGKFRAAVAEIEGAVASARSFDPRSSTRRFRLALSDIGEAILLPPILAGLHRVAPGVELEVIEVDISRLDDWLISGKVDAAICDRSDAPVGAAGEIIVTHTYVCLVSQHHPRLTKSLSMKQYLAERHVLVLLDSSRHVVENRLRELGCQRQISLRVPHFSALREIIAASDLLVTLPSRMAHLFASQCSTRVLDLPFKVPDVELTVHWHEHGGDMTAQRWFCRTLRECLGGP